MLKKKIKYDNHINMAPCVITVMLGVLGPSDSVVFLFLFTFKCCSNNQHAEMTYCTFEIYVGRVKWIQQKVS